MSRQKIKKYRITCNSMKRVTHAEDGRKYSIDMVALCDTEAIFEGVDGWHADAQARKAGWSVEDGRHTCPVNEHPGPG